MIRCFTNIAFIVTCSTLISANPPILGPCAPQGEARISRLLAIDEAMNWACPLSSRCFSLALGGKAQVFTQKIAPLQEFISSHGYLSCQKPLVGLVTEDLSDLEALQKAFSALMLSKDLNWISLATEELICKVLSYRNLQKGTKISLPTRIGKRMKLVTYEVDEVLDLWQGMPAFGLIPLQKNVHPILVFRGTDFSFLSKSSWASILSDCDVSGVGFSTFRSSEKIVQAWLQKACDFGKKTRVMGFSLGGVLAIYTTIFQNPYVERCVAFNAPGVSKSVFEELEKLASPPAIYLYATQGDLVARFGRMVPQAFEMTDRSSMGPIQAHTKIMAAETTLLLFRIDVEKENRSRFQVDETQL